jgi:hypothetical protein
VQQLDPNGRKLRGQWYVFGRCLECQRQLRERKLRRVEFREHERFGSERRCRQRRRGGPKWLWSQRKRKRFRRERIGKWECVRSHFERKRVGSERLRKRERLRRKRQRIGSEWKRVGIW